MQILIANAKKDLNTRPNSANPITLLEANTPMSIEGIAQECGYSNRQTFHRLFVEKYGLSPAEYRKNIGQLPQQPQ